MWFIYDGDGNPVGFNYISGSTFDTFYYITDLQGDITGMTDRYGGYCVTYNYDQWDKLLSQSATTSWAQKMMNLNPLRYRGYVYDSDSGLYYLQSRYYDPMTCRFVNADDLDVLQTSGDKLLDTNMFAYCDNMPVNK
ncbi:MAG: RHS repeat-associated core domain-containing protein [Bacillota bacterium]|nr:RHS repeat-associated core domain-containing protein [Bacillota bacterium]